MVRPLPVFVAVVACVPGIAPAIGHAQTADTKTAEAPQDEKGEGKDTAPPIVVTARKPSVTNKIDRRVYDVSANPDAAFSSVNDVLTRIPSVTVDARGRVALRGDGQVKVLIDGVEARPGALASLQASDIDRVEVMTNPSGQFASDGSGGIINVILKKQRREGINGMAGVRADADGRYYVNAAFSRKAGRWTTALSAGFSRTREVTLFDGLQRWATASGAETTNGFDRSVASRRQAYENASLAYALSERDTVELNYSHYRWRQTSTDAGTVRIINAAGQVIEDHGEDVLGTERGVTGEVALHYTHKGRIEGERFDLNISRDSGRSTDGSAHSLTYAVPPLAERAYAYRNDASDHGGSIKGDYERPFGKSRLTAGFLFETTESSLLSRSENLAAIVPGAPDFVTPFDYARRIAAGYVTWQTPIGGFVVMPGLRVEDEHREAGVFTRGDTRLLPSLSVNRDLSERTKLVASYSRRTQAPSLYQLNPRPIYWSRYLRYEGSPQLAWQDTDSFELGYEFTGKDFSSNGSLYYRVNHHPLTETRSVTADQVVVLSVINADRSRAAGLEWTAKGNVWRTIDYSVNLNVFDSEVTGLLGGQMLRRQYVTWSGNAVVEYKPNLRDWLQFSLTGEGRGVTLQGYKTGFYRLDVTWRHKLTPKWTASLRASDLLNSSKRTDTFATPEGESLIVSRNERPGLMIGVARKFGNGDS